MPLLRQVLLVAALSGTAAAEMQPVSPPQDALSWAQEQLQGRDGLFIGETHSGNSAGYLFLLNNLAAFKASGVTVLAVEVVNAVHQDRIDAYYANPETHAAGLKEVLQERWGSDYRFDVIERARELGIKTVAVDHRPNSEHYPVNVLNGLWAGEVRKAMAQSPGGKYIVFGGFYHGIGGDDRVPAMLGIPSLIPANLNIFPATSFGERDGYAILAQEGDIYSAVSRLAFTTAVGQEADRFQMLSGRADNQEDERRLQGLRDEFSLLGDALRTHASGFDGRAREQIRDLRQRLAGREELATQWHGRLWEALDKYTAQ
jgi:hypothetical protein